MTASKGDFQELLKLANAEPRLVNKKVSASVLYLGVIWQTIVKLISPVDDLSFYLDILSTIRLFIQGVF